jgi:hypothetical protein
MAVRHAQVSVPTSAAVVASTATFSLRDGSGHYLTVQNNTATTIYLGGSGVTTSTYGYKLVADGVLQLFLTDDDAIYAVAGTSTTVSVLVTAS